MNWGILGFGRIAQKFVKSIEALPREQIIAAASRSRAKKYESLDIGFTVWDSYKTVLQDPTIEIIYIANTHNYHHQAVLDCLNAGKHVLCEKPLGISVQQTQEMIALAQAKNLFLMEAIWTRFLPAYQAMMTSVNAGSLGNVKSVQANFSFNNSIAGSEDRLFNPDLAGGAIWDVGIYTISLAVDIFDRYPEAIHVVGNLSDQNVDLNAAILLDFGGGCSAQLNCGINLELPDHGIVSGDSATIEMKDFWCVEKFSVIKGQTRKDHYYPTDMPRSFQHEIQEVAQAISNGNNMSPIMSHQHTLWISQIMEDCLGQLKNGKTIFAA